MWNSSARNDLQQFRVALLNAASAPGRQSFSLWPVGARCRGFDPVHRHICPGRWAYRPTTRERPGLIVFSCVGSLVGRVNKALSRPDEQQGALVVCFGLQSHAAAAPATSAGILSAPTCWRYPPKRPRTDGFRPGKPVVIQGQIRRLPHLCPWALKNPSTRRKRYSTALRPSVGSLVSSSFGTT